MPSNHNDVPYELTPEEASEFKGIVSDIHLAELGDEIELIRIIQAGNVHFLEIAKKLLNGEGESGAAVQKEFTDNANILEKAFMLYTKILLEAEDSSSTIDSIVDMILADESQRVQSLRKLVPGKGGLEHFGLTKKDKLLEKLQPRLQNAETLDAKVEALLHVRGESVVGDVNALYSVAPMNRADEKRARNTRYKENLRKVSGETAKIAVGALIALIIDRKFRR